MYSLEKIKLGIEQMESRLTSNLANFLASDEISLDSLSSDLEWFLTWRMKLGDLDNRMWCNGVIDLEISKSGRHTIARISRVSGFAIVTHPLWS